MIKLKGEIMSNIGTSNFKVESTGENHHEVLTTDVAELTKKPLDSNKISSGRVDINVLKLKLEAEQGKEFRKNIFIFSFCVLLLGSIGIFLSL